MKTRIASLLANRRPTAGRASSPGHFDGSSASATREKGARHVRSNTKASSAGSTQRQATGMHLALGSLATLFLLVAVVFANSASAHHPLEYELEKRFGPDGSEASAFAEAGPVAVDQQSGSVYAADANAGTLYKFDNDGNPVNWGGSAAYISEHQISGLSFFSNAERQVAVNSTTHTIYVTSANSIRAFQADGEPSEFTAGPGAGSSAIGGLSHLTGVAVDANGYIYASDRTDDVVKIFAPSGEEVNQFAIVDPGNLAVDSTGAVYVNRRPVGTAGTVIKVTPSSFPISPATTYSVASDPVSPILSYSVAVDPASNNVYIIQYNSEPAVAVYDEDGTLITKFAEPGSEGAIRIADGVAIAEGVEGVRVYVGNRPSAGPSRVMVFRPKVDEPGKPVIENVAVADITSRAVFHARINANFLETTYRFEYGLNDCSASVCNSVPAGGASLGSGHEGEWVSEEISGLNAGTTYHYRVVAENSEGVSTTSDRTFATEPNALGFALPDGRAWEMVSPPDKHGAHLYGSGPGHIQAAADGNGLAYLSNPSIESDPDGYREINTVLARRHGVSWDSSDISPPNVRVVPALAGQQTEFKLFNPDLSAAILDPRDGTGLSSEASERAPFLRQNTQPPTYRPLVTGKEGFANVPPGTEFGGAGFVSAVTIRDATPDLSHVVLNSGVPLVAEEPTPSLYLWSEGQLEPISVLPASEGGGMTMASNPGSEPVSGRHPISTDGSRVFWTAFSPSHLYMRDMEAGESARIDVLAGGSGSGKSDPVFQGASADGSVVYFTDSRQLTEGASPSGVDLYRCEIGDPAAGCASLINISAPLEGSGESADVLGVVSALSDDGSTAFFVARGVLETEANQLGHSAASGEPNLYLWREGEGLRFIATLAEEDGPDWGKPGTLPARDSSLSTAISPSGRHFAFMSQLRLTDPELPGAGNVDVRSGEAVEQIFRYDVVTERLECVSCRPTGAAPRGRLVDYDTLVDPRVQWQERHVAAILPQATTINQGGPNRTIYRPRAIFDSGRLFFNAFDALVPADSNGHWDVYQHEPFGVGDCSASSGGGSTSLSGGACVSLISSGTADQEAGFLDASASGDDVFFLTPARLSVTDVDNQLDVYDARVGGVEATLPANNECLGEACQPAAQVPNDPTPASAAFKGQGNLAQLRECGSISRRVARLSRRAKGLRARAKAASSPKAARQMRGKARRLSRKASRLGKQAKRCRRANRRAAR